MYIEKNEWLSSDGLALIDLMAASLAIIWQAALPRLGWEPLLIVAIPFVVRIADRKRLIERTPYDIGIGLFLLSAGIGAWISYDQEAAWLKFWRIVAAILLFVALTRQPFHSILRVVALGSLASVFVAVYFLFTHNWMLQPADFPLLNAVAIRWMSIRPQLNYPTLHPNVIGGIIAALMPLSVVNVVNKLRRGQQFRISLFFLAISLAGILFTSSRGAWIALTVSTIVSVWVLRGVIHPRLHKRWLFAAIFIIPIGLWLIIISTSRMPVLLDAVLPGAPAVQSRFEIFRNSLSLVMDFPFTGGGLDAFPGLYSRYILVITQFFFGYAHNLYLDLVISQGPLGLLAFLGIIVCGVWMLVKSQMSIKSSPTAMQDLQLAVIAGFLIISLHGLIDDPLYSSSGIALLFLYPGLSVGLLNRLAVDGGEVQKGIDTSFTSIRKNINRHKKWAWSIPIVLIILASACWKSIASRWYSNIASLILARTELDGFPHGPLLVDTEFTSDQSAEEYLRKSIDLDPSNHTAFQRAGMLAIRHDDFQYGIQMLEFARELRPNHRGIFKSLGYAYVWNGDITKAYEILEEIPEAAYEMEVYAWWWDSQGKSDLANYSENMARLLVGEGSSAVGED